MSASGEIRCPSCGAPLAPAFSGAQLIVCAYCRAYVAIGSGVALVTGAGVPLAKTPTPFAIGQRLGVDGATWSCVGRVRYAYQDGFWDEWQLAADGATARIQEDEGDLVLWSSVERLEPAPDLRPARPGGVLRVGVRAIVVAERGRARLAGAEGSLDRTVEPGETFEYLDGHARPGVVSVRVAGATALLLTGAPLERAELSIEPGPEEGTT